LQRVLYLINTYPEYRFEIRSYTDNIGDADYNNRLTQTQAEKVKDWLVARGADSSRIDAVGYGSSNPIASNDNLEGRLRNRRIELVRIE
jgi:outer membrane protein OmpA-like peptidoglycan-associated protein